MNRKLIELQPLSYRDWVRPGERYTIDFRVTNNSILPMPVMSYALFKDGVRVRTGFAHFPFGTRTSNVVSIELVEEESGWRDYAVELQPIPLLPLYVERWEFTMQVVE